MPPKARLPSAPPSPGRNFNIASFFDAASAGRRAPQRFSGHGFRIDRPSPSQAGSDGLASSSQPSTFEGGAYHWSSGLASTDALASGGSTTGEARAEMGYSGTMEAVRQRILDDLRTEGPAEGSKATSRGAPYSLASSTKFQQHRKRAMAIAFGGEDDLMVSAVEFALACPYSRLPLHVPVRSRLCSHVQCCDLDSWMVLMDKHKSLRDPKGPCPVCEQRVAASTLEVDLWMLHVLQQMPAGTHLVVLEADGNYHSGDTTRERRRDEMAMEVIDATQAEFENFLGDIVDDDDGVDVVAAETRHKPVSSSTTAVSSTTAGAKRDRAPSVEAVTSTAASDPPPVDPRVARVARSEPMGPTIFVKQEPSTITAELRDLEKAGEHPEEVGDGVGSRLASLPPEPSQAPLPTQEDGVVIVHFIEPTAHGRALPSRIREWVFYCPDCHTAQLKGESTTAAAEPSPGPATPASADASPPLSMALPSAGERCSHCAQTSRDEWSLVRRFAGTPTPITMELTADGTVLLRGVDAAAPYLYRAGFIRSRFAPEEFQHPSPAGFHPAVGLWVTSAPLSRFEVDFLEACCERLASGETELESFEGMMVPALFRIPRRRRVTTTAENSGSANGHRFFASQRS